MAVTRIGHSYLVNGEEAKQIENYVFKRSKKERDEDARKEKARWEKSLQKRKAILAL